MLKKQKINKNKLEIKVKLTEKEFLEAIETGKALIIKVHPKKPAQEGQHVYILRIGKVIKNE